MAGGDLDGDVYFVCWDKSVTDHLSEDKLYDPAVYKKPVLINQKPKKERISDYIVFYFERDVLGKLANMHLALCDHFGIQGPMKKECIELSGLQSIAVDFAKHGECVSARNYEHLERILNNTYPHFLEKHFKPSRESTGVLGLLYDQLNIKD